MSLLIVGAGATGAFFGAAAARGGLDVTFVARGPHGAAMRERGVRVVSPREEFSARPRVVASLDEAGTGFDIVLVTVKTFDLAGVLPAAARAGRIIVTAQNGVDAEDEAMAHVPPERVVGAVLVIGASVAEPGVVRYHGLAHAHVGAPRPESAEAARHVADVLAKAGVPASLAPDLAVARWSKLVWNNAYNAITALTRLPVQTANKVPGVRDLATRAMREVEAVARAEGVALPDNIVEHCLMQADFVGDVRTSMLQDAEAGRRLEHEALVGAVVRRARARGIATPVNDVLYVLLAALASRASLAPPIVGA